MSAHLRLFILIFSLAVCLAPTSALAEDKGPVFIPKELLVKFKVSDDAKTNKEIQKLGAKLLEKLSTIDVSRLKLPKGLTVEKAVKTLQAMNIVEYAEPNFVQKPIGWINDPYYPDQWGLDNMRALKGWGIHTGRRQTIIAVVDTGVDLDHPDLQKKLVAGYDFVDDDDKPDDVGGHGTHCAGITAAIANNKTGVVGVCPNCSVMPIRSLGPNGGSTSDTAKGVIWATDHGAHVISMSFGGYNESATMRDALDYAARKGVVLVAAAGNDNTKTPFYPAYDDTCIAVGSLERDNARSSFSNYGDWVDVAAPGGFIFSTVPDKDYTTKSGTSMAAPHVAGLAGLMRSCPGATPQKIRRAIENSSISVGDWVSHGKVDVPNALNELGCKKPTSSGGSSGGGADSGGANTGGGTGSATGDSSNGSGKTPDKKPDDSAKGAPPSAPVTHHVTLGAVARAPKDALEQSDDRRLALVSKGSGLSNILDVYFEKKIDPEVDLESMEIVVEAYTDNPGEFTVKLYNWQKRAWDWLGKTSVDHKDKAMAYKRASPASYVGANGEVRVSFYRKERLWNGFELNVDLVRLKLTEKKAAPDKDEGGGIGDKAKDAWGKFKKKF